MYYSCKWAWWWACVTLYATNGKASRRPERHWAGWLAGSPPPILSMVGESRDTWPARILSSQFMCTAIEQGYPVCRSRNVFVAFNPFDLYNVFHFFFEMLIMLFTNCVIPGALFSLEQRTEQSIARWGGSTSRILENILYVLHHQQQYNK